MKKLKLFAWALIIVGNLVVGWASYATLGTNLLEEHVFSQTVESNSVAGRNELDLEQTFQNLAIGSLEKKVTASAKMSGLAYYCSSRIPATLPISHLRLATREEKLLRCNSLRIAVLDVEDDQEFIYESSGSPNLSPRATVLTSNEPFFVQIEPADPPTPLEMLLYIVTIALIVYLDLGASRFILEHA